MVCVMATAFFPMMVIVGVPVLVIKGGHTRTGVGRTIWQTIAVNIDDVIQLDQGGAEGQEGDQSQCNNVHNFPVMERYLNSIYSER